MLFARGKLNPSSVVPCDPKTHRPICPGNRSVSCPGNPGGQSIWMHAAPTPSGPWRRIAPICGSCDNAAPIFLPNGSLVVVYSDCDPATDPDCPLAPAGTDAKRNETVMMAASFRIAFAERWDNSTLSLRGLRSYVGRLPINPYVSFNASE